MTNDDRPKFVGVFQAASTCHGPPSMGIGIEISCSYAGTSTWAVDDRGVLYNLCDDYTGEYGKAGYARVWVAVHAPVVRDCPPRKPMD